MTPARPYTPDQLGERWHCSGETVRLLVKSGALRGFRVGRMIRIPRDAVEEYECPKSTSDGLEADSVSIGMIAPANEFAVSLRHAPERTQKPKQ
ncbi:excisionase family DNA-binding protein [Parasedimentitalea psychrophila]|uniref:excisionase family DNA-binding protein n=1 Tax=Parasedimentitalea psychrophila TaxID=2997337 RepID=UPI0036F3F0E5